MVGSAFCSCLSQPLGGPCGGHRAWGSGISTLPPQQSPREASPRNRGAGQPSPPLRLLLEPPCPLEPHFPLGPLLSSHAPSFLSVHPSVTPARSPRPLHTPVHRPPAPLPHPSPVLLSFHSHPLTFLRVLSPPALLTHSLLVVPKSLLAPLLFLSAPLLLPSPPPRQLLSSLWLAPSLWL